MRKEEVSSYNINFENLKSFLLQIKEDAKKDDEYRCFICGIERSEFDKQNKVSIHKFCDYYS